MRTALYLRISQDRTGEAAGVERQRQDCEQLASELGWRVVGVYVDNSVEATSGKPRPEYLRMLGDIKAGHIDAIIAWHTDRLYRRLEDLQELIAICDHHRIAIRTCRAGELDLSTPTGRLVARILGSVATHEGEHKADRWRRSYLQRREAGVWMAAGPRTFGYERDGTIRPDEAEAIRKAARDILSGVKTLDICRTWNAEGRRTTRGRPWTPTSLRVLLTNPRLAGLVTLKGEIIGPGTWDPILDRETWEQVRALYLRRKDNRPRASTRSLLSGIALCGLRIHEDLCSRVLIRSTTSMPIYRCRTYQSGEYHVTVSARALEEMVEAYAQRRLEDDKVRRMITARIADAGTTAAAIQREIDDVELEIAEREDELRQAGRSQRARLAAMAAIDDLDSRLGELRHQLSLVVPVQLPDQGEWPKDLGRRSALIRIAVDRVIVHPAKGRSSKFDEDRVEIIPR